MPSLEDLREAGLGQAEALLLNPTLENLAAVEVQLTLAAEVGRRATGTSVEGLGEVHRLAQRLTRLNDRALGSRLGWARRRFPELGEYGRDGRLPQLPQRGTSGRLLGEA